MPNIFICGFGERAEEIKEIIDKAMQNIKLQDEAITSIVEMKAESCDGKRTSSPYLRVCSDNKPEIKQIIKALHKFKIGEDVESLLIDDFFPAKVME